MKDISRRYISRRSACRAIALGALASAGSLVVPSLLPLASGRMVSQADASEATAEALSQAQAEYDSLQSQLDEIASEVEQINIELSSTLDAIEAKQGEIDATTAQIQQTQEQLSAYQDELAEIMANDYKGGTTEVLDVLLSSASYEELTRNIYYLTKFNDSETELINQTWTTKKQLEDAEAQLEQQLSDLQSLRSQQESQLAEVQDRQSQTYSLLESASAEVQALTEQYNQELIAEAQAAEEARLAAEQAAAAAAASDASYYSGDTSSDGSSSGGGSVSYGSASAVVNACYSTPSPGYGLCAMWVTNVFSNAGIGYFGGNACDMYSAYCYSSDTSALSPGMIIAVSTHNLTTAGAIYGHIGIYIGGGTVMDNIGYIRSIGVDEWISTYSTTVTARWGWLGGVVLS